MNLRRFNRSFYLVVAIVIIMAALQVAKYGIWALNIIAS